ncbi:MAG: hypothetical protein PHW69_09175 [Elusimicrobiaceae bacterium]|nr:hypothetical protein [Elusimicrobiaceae bacterium]
MKAGLFFAAVCIFSGPGLCGDKGSGSASALKNSIVKDLAEPVLNGISGAAEMLASPGQGVLPPDEVWNPSVFLPAYGAANSLTRKIMDLFITPISDASLGNLDAAIGALASPGNARPVFKELSVPRPPPGARSVADSIAEVFINPLIRKIEAGENAPAASATTVAARGKPAATTAGSVTRWVLSSSRPQVAQTGAGTGKTEIRPLTAYPVVPAALQPSVIRASEIKPSAQNSYFQ